MGGDQDWIQDLPRDAAHSECRAWAYNGRLGAEPTAGPRGRTPGGISGKLKASSLFLYKKGQNLRI